jgi:hypothetical protein
MFDLWAKEIHTDQWEHIAMGAHMEIRHRTKMWGEMEIQGTSDYLQHDRGVTGAKRRSFKELGRHSTRFKEFREVNS